MITAGMPMADYLRYPAVSAGLLNTLLDRCPRAAWYQSWLNPLQPPSDDTAATDAGSIAHAILLEGSRAGVEVIDPNLYPTKSSGAIPTGWTNQAIRGARDAARAAGKIPVLSTQMEEIELMVQAARDFITTLRDSEPAVWRAFQPGGGVPEVTITGSVGETAVKIRPDLLATDHELIVDAKFTATSAEPDLWGRSQMVRMGYYRAAAFYRRVVGLDSVAKPSYVFLVVETAPPYLCSLVGVDEHAMALGDAQMTAALETWSRCAREGQWPGYPTKVAYPELPAWVEAAWSAQEADGYGGTA